MSDRRALEGRLARLREELAAAEGTPTEVYSRIVGYYRSVRNWNAGKRDEYGQRLAYSMPVGLDAGKPRDAGETSADGEAVEIRQAIAGGTVAADAAAIAGADDSGRETIEDPRPRLLPGSGILVFTREACPNCPPVSNYVMGAGIPATFVDVDQAEGLELARRHGVMATPTVLGLDLDGREAFRAYAVKDLQARFGTRAAPGP